LEQILSIIYDLGTPIHLNKVKAHTGAVGNESAGAVLKHAMMLLSIIMILTRQSNQPHLMAILSPMYTGSRKGKMIISTIPLEPALQSM